MRNARRMIRDFLSVAAPGLHEILDLYCLSRFGRDSASLLLENPERLRECVVELYGSDEAAEMLLKLLMQNTLS
ncbi:MAG: hypothetical protein QXS42_00520 [Zestosphaera sp.]